MITPHNLVRHELIGLQVRIADSANRQQIGLQGRVVDETRNTLTVEIAGHDKRFVKDQCDFSFTLPGSKTRVRVHGQVIVGRPEDRIKKKMRVW